MSANGWFDVDKTQRLVPLSDEDLCAPVELVEPPERLTLEKIEFTATEVIAIRFRDLPPPPAPVEPKRERTWVAIALAAAAVVALVCLI